MWQGALAGALLAVVLAAYGGYRTGSTFKQSEWDAAVLGKQKGEAAALKAAAEAIAKIEVKSEQLIQPVRVEIRTNTVYRDCKHSDDSLRNLNALIGGTEPTGSGVVPSANAPR
jgi:hypothetical protein